MNNLNGNGPSPSFIQLCKQTAQIHVAYLVLCTDMEERGLLDDRNECYENMLKRYLNLNELYVRSQFNALKKAIQK